MSKRLLSKGTRQIHPSKIGRSTHIIGSNDISKPTQPELDIIDGLTLVKDQNFESPSQYTSKARQKYLLKKLPIVKEIFKCEEHPGFLSYRKPSHLPNPYYDAYARRIINVESGVAEYKGTARLSVTKMLTKRWCELREAFDIYSNVPIYEHNQVKVGKREHQKLEDAAHAPPLNVQDFQEDFELDIPDDPFHSLVEEWLLAITKMTTLFHKGYARELLCHGYIDSRTGELTTGKVEDEEEVLVSGVVDHLFIRNKSFSNKHSVPLDEHLLENGNNDLRLVLELILDSLKNAGDLEVIVSDVKTRPTLSVPSQSSVIKASKLQVMYYRYFLELLGNDPQIAYQKLLTNAVRRGFDVERHVDPAKIIHCLEIDNTFMEDMKRLKSGIPIGFAPFDDADKRSTSPETYSMLSLNDKITDLRIQQKYSELFDDWSTPVTLKYFAARMAQLYACIAPLLSQNLMVEYYRGDYNFHNMAFAYDLQELKKQSFDSALFWFGKREILPIKQNLKNFETYCKFCDYQSVCLWKKEGQDLCQTLGKNLAQIHDQGSLESRNDLHIHHETNS